MKLTEANARLMFSFHTRESENSSIPGGIAVNTKRFIFLFVLASGLISFTRPLFAHHSVAEFDMTNLTTIKGTVTRYEWTNPHAYIYLQAKDDKGNVEEWMGELGALGMMSRVNWKRDTVKPGDQITVFGNRAKDGKLMMHIDRIVLPNGQELSAHLV
jgi:hypothetical protein